MTVEKDVGEEWKRRTVEVYGIEGRMWKRRTLEKEESIGEVWRRTEKKGGGEGCWGRMLGKNGKEGWGKRMGEKLKKLEKEKEKEKVRFIV